MGNRNRSSSWHPEPIDGTVVAAEDVDDHDEEDTAFSERIHLLSSRSDPIRSGRSRSINDGDDTVPLERGAGPIRPHHESEYAGSVDSKLLEGHALISDTARRETKEGGGSGAGGGKASGNGLGCFHPTRWTFRYTFLVLACLLSFGSYFCYDNPAALQTTIQNDLNITTSQYQLFYTVYSIPNTVMVFFGGYLIDAYFGVRFGGFLYSAITLAGQIVFAFGASTSSYGIMIAGRVLFGIGGESITVAQNLYVARAFSGKELAMALGITLSVSRLGSAVNMDIMPMIASQSGLAGALWFGSAICGISLIMAIFAGLMDRQSERAHKQLKQRENAGKGDDASPEEEIKAGADIRFSDVLKFPYRLWLIFIICVFFYCAVFPFISISSDYFHDKYGYSTEKSGQIAGIPYTVSAIVSPFLGFIVDRLGYKPLFLLSSCIGLVGVHAWLGFSNIDPLYPMILLGLMYSICAAALWPCVPEIVDPEIVGTAYGLMQAIQNAGLALAAFGVGALKDSYSYKVCIIFFGFCVLAAALFTILLIIEDCRTGLKLSRRQAAATVAENVKPSAFYPREALAVWMPSVRRSVLPRTAIRIRSGYLSRLRIYSTPPVDAFQPRRSTASRSRGSGVGVPRTSSISGFSDDENYHFGSPGGSFM